MPPSTDPPTRRRRRRGDRRDRRGVAHERRPDDPRRGGAVRPRRRRASWRAPAASRRRPATASSWPSPPRTCAASATSSTPSPATTSSTTPTTSSSPGSPARVTRPRSVMNAKLTAALLILAAVLANVGFTALGSIFNYPDVLDEPAGKVLAAFRDHQGAVSAWFSVLALSAALLAPIAIGVGRLSARARHADRGAGRDRGRRRAGHRPAALADPRARLRRRRERRRVHVTTASDILGTAIGETLGYLLTATWTVLVIVALGRRYAGRWFQVLGGVSAALVARRRPLAARAARDRHRELHRLRPLEPVADRLRRRDPGPRAAPAARRAEPVGGDVVTGAALARAGRAVREPARDRHRQHDRQRRAADAGARPRGGRGRAPVGRRRLHARVRRAAAAGRRARGPLRAPAHAARGARGVRRRLGVRRLRGRRRRADRRPRGHGRGRRVHHARDALAAHHRLHRRARARDWRSASGPRPRGSASRSARSSAASCSTTSGGARSSSSTSR